MCIMAYTTVLFLEFLSPVCEKFGYHVPLRLLRTIEMPLVVAAAAISTLHQSSLGTFFLIAVDKLHPLWYNPLLPLLFWVSAMCAGISIITVEATMSHKWMGQPDEGELLETLAKILPWVLTAYLTLRIFSLIALTEGALWDRPGLIALFALEMAALVTPLVMLTSAKVREHNRLRSTAAWLVIFGVVVNRFNVSMFGMMQKGTMYYPSLIESIVTIGIIAAHVLFFVLIAKYFPIFEHHPETVDYSLPDTFHKTGKGQAAQGRVGSEA